ncbi:hypothetical protein LIER_08366 [Lithospermum erythrorhizon]|uniref:DUF4283 domain-containing protein n=1 Tax=Lithospermum erythrorhizon TaxID=34254 RepID=A0AAV3PG16_LITER
MTKVMDGGPYMVWGKTLLLKVVQDGMEFNDDLFLDIPIWVKFYNVPLGYWNRKGLGKIASKLRRPLYSDQVTSEYSRATYARIFVEVNVSEKPVFYYEVKLPNGKIYTQLVSYENFPEYCYHCKGFKHGWDSCKELKRLEDLTKRKEKEDRDFVVKMGEGEVRRDGKSDGKDIRMEEEAVEARTSDGLYTSSEGSLEEGGMSSNPKTLSNEELQAKVTRRYKSYERCRGPQSSSVPP